MPLPQTVIVADDHPLFRTALEQAVRQAFPDPGIVTVEDFNGLQAAISDAADAQLLLLDLNMPGSQGYSQLVYARREAPGLPVIVVSAFESPDVIHAAMEHGAAGFIPKSSDMQTMVAAIKAVLAGQVWLPEGADTTAVTHSNDVSARVDTLTPQQLRVLFMVTEGKLNKQIAFDLDISEATVKAHITAILRKLAVYTRTQAVLAVRDLEIDWDAAARRAAQLNGIERF